MIDLDALADMTVAELREKYVEVFGEACRSKHKDFLRKRIAWRMQANAEGGLSDRARRRAEELANDADLRLLGPKARTEIHRFKPTQDRRLPLPGTVITRTYQGRTLSVTVLSEGFEYSGQTFKSLTAVAKVITGTHWNGYHFFGLRGRP